MNLGRLTLGAVGVGVGLAGLAALVGAIAFTSVRFDRRELGQPGVDKISQEVLAKTHKVWQAALVMSGVISIGAEADPAKRLRQEWADSLREHMHARGMTRKELQNLLATQGIDVSRQAIGFWLRGETSPRPHHQAALAAIFAVPARRLFPIEAA